MKIEGIEVTNGDRILFIPIDYDNLPLWKKVLFKLRLKKNENGIYQVSMDGE